MHQEPVITSKDMACHYCEAEPGAPCVEWGPNPYVLDGYHLTRREAFRHYVVARRRSQ